MLRRDQGCCSLRMHYMNAFINKLRSERNGQNFSYDISKCIFLNGNGLTLIKNSPKFFPNSMIDNILLCSSIFTCILKNVLARNETTKMFSLSIRQHWFRKWPSVDHAPEPMMKTFSTRAQCVNDYWTSFCWHSSTQNSYQLKHSVNTFSRVRCDSITAVMIVMVPCVLFCFDRVLWWGF